MPLSKCIRTKVKNKTRPHTHLFHFKLEYKLCLLINISNEALDFTLDKSTHHDQCKRQENKNNYNWASLAWRIYGQLFEAGIANTDRLSAITYGRRFTWTLVAKNLATITTVVFPHRQIEAFLTTKTVVHLRIVSPLSTLQFGVFHLMKIK